LVVLLMAGATLSAMESKAAPLGLPPYVQSSTSRALVALGRELFSDRRLSADGTVSCASCHKPEGRFSDGRARARGIYGQLLTRRTPSLLNVRYARSLFWDGRETDLAAQARFPLLGPAEHGLQGERAVVALVGRDKDYAAAFAHLFGPEHPISLRDVGIALAAYERTLTSGNSPF